MTGKTVSHYRILEKLGEGGMGVVYRAEDTKLKRTVALKFLPPQALEGMELRERFLHEAQAAAALSHPNVCVVYEIDEEHDFIAMELLGGETVEAKVKRRPLPLPEALDLAIHAALGLHAAHERGIVHRDIKPGNLMVTTQGIVKIMDFGLARLSDQTRLTKTAAVMGTPAYMSPEQVRGESVDHRSDIWSLGVVLYEMVAGQRPFRGEVEHAISFAIVNEPPEPLSALRSGVPLELDRVVEKALAKDKDFRYQHADEFLSDLRKIAKTIGAGKVATGSIRAAAEAPKYRRALIGGAIAGLVIGAAAAGVLAWRWRSPDTARVARFSVPLQEGEFIPASFNNALAFSPDGSQFVYRCVHAGAINLKLRQTDQLESRLINDNKIMGAPFFSPDGGWLGFIMETSAGLFKLPLKGGAQIKLLDWESFGGGTWGPDNRIYYVPSLPGGIVSVSADGKDPKEIVRPDVEKGERLFKHPSILPNGTALLYTVATKDSETSNESQIVAYSLKTHEKKVLVEGGMYARYSPSGHLIFAKNGSLYAAPFDETNLALTGNPVSVLDGVLMSVTTGQAYYNVSGRGDLVYAPGPVEGGKRTLVWINREGREEPLDLPARSYLHPRISPDGSKLAIEAEGANHDWYIHDFNRGVLTKMTTDGLSHWPSWSPDGNTISFRSGIMGRFSMSLMPADRSGEAIALSRNKPADLMQSPVGWSPDGKYLTFEEGSYAKGIDIYALPVGSNSKPVPISSGKFIEGSPKFSPDGAWLAFCTNESKRPEVYVQPFPGPGPKIQISSDGGTDPVWRRRPGELYYRNGDKMMVVDVATKPTFRAGRPRELWSGHYSHGMSSSCGPPGPTSSNYDVSPDGKRFLMIKDAAQDAVAREIVVVLGWAGELKRLDRERRQQPTPGAP